MTLLSRVLLRWRIILICGLVFALLGCVRSYMSQKKSIEAKQQAYSDVVIPEEKLETARNFKSSMSDALSDAIDDKTEYMTDSVLRQLSDECYLATAIVYVQTDGTVSLNNYSYTLNPESNNPDTVVLANARNFKTASVESALEQIVYNGIDYSGLTADLGISDQMYLKELLEINTDAGNLVIGVYYPEQTGAKKIIDFILDNLSQKQEDLHAVYGDFGYSSLYVGTGSVRNPFYKWTYGNMTELNNIVTAQTTLNNISGSVSGMSNTLKADSSKNASMSLKTLVKQSLVFGVLGCAVSSALIALYLILSNRVLSAQEIDERYQTNTLAESRKGKKGRRNASGDDDMTKICADAVQELDAMNADVHKVLLVGDVDPQKLSSICENLKKYDQKREYAVFDSQFSADPDAEYTAVLVSELEKTNVANTDELVRRLKLRKIPLTGSIVC